MSTHDAQMLDEVLAGRPVPEVAARYNVTPEYIERIADEAASAPQPESIWGWRALGGRVVTSLAVGYVAWLLTGRESAAIIGLIAIIWFGATTLIASRRR